MDFKDRIVEFPHRYRLVQVPDQPGVYDFIPVPGKVTEQGDFINRMLMDNLQKDTVKKAKASTFEKLMRGDF